MSFDPGSDLFFAVSTDLNGVQFFSNKQTGRWALAKCDSHELRSYLSRKYSANATQRLPMIVLNMERQCNLNCSYCLTGQLREQRRSLSLEVGMKTLDRVLELEENDRHVVFHGSEPMLNFPVIQELVLYAEKLDSKISFSIQTNGTMLSDKNLKFLKKHSIGVGVSFDGLRKHHDATRRYKNGLSSYSDVKHAVQRVKDHQGYVSVITVVTSSNVKELQEIVENFENLGIKSVFFHPVCCSTNSTLFPKENDLIQQTLKIMDRYVNRKLNGKNTIKIQNFSKAIKNFFSSRYGINCLPCGGGSRQPLLAIDIDGLIYPCDFFWESDDYQLGSIYDTSLKDALISGSNFRNTKSSANVRTCQSCNWQRFCGGGCPGEVLSSDKTLNSASPYCNYYKSVFNYVARKIPLIHQKHMIKEFLTQ